MLIVTRQHCDDRFCSHDLFATQAMELICYPTSTLEGQIESHDQCSGHCALRHQLHVARRSIKARRLRSDRTEVALYHRLLGHHH